MINNELNLKIENFQIIRKAELKFEKGVNLIVGQSGNGKSSILRAIKTLLLNSSGSQKNIRHGADSTSVSMYYNGNDVEWKRTKTGSKYIINGQEYSKLGTSNLNKVLDNSGFVIDYKNDILNLEGAWQVLFPYDKSDAELFKLFENIFCVSDSGKIYQSFKVEEDRLNKELQEAQAILNKNKFKIDSINSLQEKVDLDKLKDYKARLLDFNNNYSNLNNSITIIDQVDKYLSVVKDDCKVITFNYTNLVNYQQVYKGYNEIKTITSYVDVLDNVNKHVKIFNLENVNRYEKLSKDILFIENINKYPKVKEGSAKTFNKDTVNKYEKLTKDIKLLEEVNKYPEVKEDSIKSFNKDLLDKYLSIKKDLDKIKEISRELRQIKENKEKIEKEIEDLNIILSNHSCKTCEVCNGVGVVDQ